MSLAGAAAVVLVVRLAPQWLASTEGLSPKDRAEELGRVRTALLATIAGAIAVVGAYYTGRTFGLSRQGQITERFTRAVDQLGHEQVDVRLGGIYALERLARESRDDHGPIVEILTAYVREHARLRPPPAGSRPAQPGADSLEPGAGDHAAGGLTRVPTLSTDVQAALTVLGRRTLGHEVVTQVDLDLRSTDLSGADLAEARLEGAMLQDVRLEGAILSGARLEGAILERARLEGATMVEVHLEGASLVDAHLEEARLHAAHLDAAILSRAHLERANLAGAHLEGAFLDQAHLEGAFLGGAQLQRARLLGAHLEGAQIVEAHLVGGSHPAGGHKVVPNLVGAQLQGADLGGVDLNGARYSSSTAWPDGFDPAAHGAVAVDE